MDLPRLSRFEVFGELSLSSFVAAHPHPVLLVPVPKLGSADGVDRTETVERPAVRSDQTLVYVIEKRLSLTDPRIAVGRGVSVDLEIPFSTISRLHAWFLGSPRDGYAIADAGSKNGTFLDGELLEPGRAYPLLDDPHLQLGDLEVNFLMPDQFHRELAARLRLKAGLGLVAAAP